MDHREESTGKSAYNKELEQEGAEAGKYDDYVTVDGKQFRIPYKIIREVVFSNIRKDELISIENAARLQYRLMLLEPVVRAKVEFTKQKITVVYNPDTAHNRKEKMSLDELISFFKKEGVHLSNNPRQERDFDYFKEMYEYQFNSPQIREKQPYGYTIEEWQKMKGAYKKKMSAAREKDVKKFKVWQNSYATEHADLLPEYAKSVQHKKPSLAQRLFGKKGKGEGEEQKFWFHGA